ncbi:D-alanyl-D-alanine carboxypeptidase [Alicyclobacillus mengziensis]|uniref:D-alanyl-D-alanine carboxypeptidase n=2 Tax=Alicyclobacillus mengziensis TaxID=2931921 RepID=A0A9X7Z9G3_9BACL|nr:D-alanyl-D-alanine carboxypeptidase [Alicyclobacillus mengziensis]
MVYITCFHMPVAEASVPPGLDNAAASMNTSDFAAKNGDENPLVLNQTWVNGVPMTSQPEPFPNIISQAAVVMDMTTGTVVYAKAPLTEHYPASITKIMTAILALQHGKLSDIITVSKNAANQPPDKLYFVPGEQKTLKQMLYGLLLISANDAAVAIAEKYGGSVSGFANMMNAEAKALGANHTHFVNPNGLPNPNHVTTAYDMALISRAAMQIPEFRKIVATKSYNWKGQAWQSKLYNINHMLFTYPGAIGIKTGFTDVAHETLAVAATHGNDTFLAILLDAPTNYEIDNDATQLLNFAFAHYQTETIAHRGEILGQLQTSSGKVVPLYAAQNVLATVDKSHPIQPKMTIQLRTLPPGSSVTQGITFDTGTLSINAPFLEATSHTLANKNGTLDVGDVSYAIPSQPMMTMPVYVNLHGFTRHTIGTSNQPLVSKRWFIPAGSGLLVLIVVSVVFFIRRKIGKRRKSASLLMEATRRQL